VLLRAGAALQHREPEAHRACDAPRVTTALRARTESRTWCCSNLVASINPGAVGMGPVISLPTASDDRLGAREVGRGPALGFTARSGKLLWGLFSQNLFSFGRGRRPG